jgi:CheY-like chemotaxis protein
MLSIVQPAMMRLKYLCKQKNCRRDNAQMRFLIVDDTARARQSMKALLEVWGFADELYEAVNAAEALRFAEECQPDIILMDARLPGMSGLEATRMIKEKWAQITVIVLSVFTDYQPLAAEAGADAFVSKSDPPDVLRKVILQFLPKGGRNE